MDSLVIQSKVRGLLEVDPPDRDNDILFSVYGDEGETVYLSPEQAKELVTYLQEILKGY